VSTDAAANVPWQAVRRSFDPLAQRAEASRLSFDEEELLRETHWAMGEDARLREDSRFRPTPWGRWIASSAFLANDALFARLRSEPYRQLGFEEGLAQLDGLIGSRCVLCPGDPRLVLDNGSVRLAASGLTHDPRLESDAPEGSKYITHLPLHRLGSAAAAPPVAEWGGRPQHEVVAPVGWVRLFSPPAMNPRMFVAQLEDDAMDTGKNAHAAGRYAVFEFCHGCPTSPLNALIRGPILSSHDADHAVRRYSPTARDSDGTVNRVELTALHLDEQRFPKLVLSGSRARAVAVVAKVLCALGPDDFLRRPRPVRRPGRRDLETPEARAAITERLAGHVSRFFEPLQPQDAAEPEVARNEWRAALVCMDAEAGGLQLEVGPLAGLWSFVKQLRVRGHQWQACVLASNVRLRAVRVSVPPASGPWHWAADGFEDDPDVDFSGLSMPSLEAGAALAFRVDGAGVGRLVRSSALATGRCYRVLIPTALLGQLTTEPRVSTAGGGWHIWELDLTERVGTETHLCCRELGFDIGDEAARLDWVLVAPVAWRTTPADIPYPCFVASQSPVLALDGPATDADGASQLFLHGPRGSENMPLPAGQRHLLRLDGLAPGRYAAVLLFDRTAIAPERLCFEVVDAAPLPPAAAWQLDVMGETVTPAPGSVADLAPRDLGEWHGTEADGGEAARWGGIEAPPGWPVRILWREVTEDVLLTTYAGCDGSLETAPLVGAALEHRTRRPLGDLVFDLAELGAAIVRHERRPNPEAIRARLEELVTTRSSAVARLSGAYVDLVPIWFAPVCAALGYAVEPIAAGDGPTDRSPLGHAAVCRLLHTERVATAIHRQPVRLLVLLERFDAEPSSEVLACLDALCAHDNMRDVILSDGLRWATHRRGSRLPPGLWELDRVVRDAPEFLGFVRAVAEGV